MSARTLPALPIAVLAAMVALTYWLNQFVQLSAARNDGSERHTPDVIVENFTAKALGTTGEVQYTVKALKMLHFPHDDSSLLDTVIFTALHPNLPPIIAQAPRGRLVGGAEEVIMDGGVLVTSAKTEKFQALSLSTPTLSIFPGKNMARSTDGVRLESPTGQLTADRMELNSLTRRLRLEKGRATFQQLKSKTK